MLNAGKLIKVSLVLLIGVYLCTLGILYAVQDNLLFPAPSKIVENLPDGAQFAEMQTEDGKTLRHVRLEGDEGAPKVMFFHDNGSLAAAELERGRILQENGFDVLLVEYRGYGGSDGEPSSEAFLKDSLAVYDWYKSDDNDWMFLYGHSLGTGVAAYVSANRPVTSLVLEAPYTRLSDIAASKHPIFPVRMLLKHEIDTVQALKSHKTPTMVIHGKLDQVIPVSFGEALYQTLDADNAELNIIEDANHNNMVAKGSVDLALGYFSKSF